MPTIALPDGRTIAYHEAGSGPPVLLLPDADQDLTAVVPLLEALEDRGRVFVPLRHSEAPGAADRAATAAALLEAADAAPAIVIGLGAGAGVALHLGARHAEVVHRIIADSPILAEVPEALLGDVFCHVLLVWGEADAAVPAAHKGRIALQLPRAQRVTYVGAGGGYAAHRARFLADLRAWLLKDPPPARVPLNEDRPSRRRGPVVFDA